VIWRFWAAVLLLDNRLVHLVRAVTLEDRSDYQSCLTSPADCIYLCVPPSLAHRTSVDALMREGGVGCDGSVVNNAGLTGTVPTELGLMTAMTEL
jgi:hypothetical protein